VIVHSKRLQCKASTTFISYARSMANRARSVNHAVQVFLMVTVAVPIVTQHDVKLFEYVNASLKKPVQSTRKAESRTIVSIT